MNLGRKLVPGTENLQRQQETRRTVYRLVSRI